MNRFAGGKLRKFANLDKTTIEKVIKLIEKNIIKYLDTKKNYNLGIHFLRIKCGNNFVGYPVPEGWHKDGFDFVIILNVIWNILAIMGVFNSANIYKAENKKFTKF